jgi:hypothetical protein
MATYLGIHDMGGAVSEDQLGSSWEEYKKTCEELGVKAQHVHFSAESGRAFCLTEAESAGQVQKAHDKAGVPLKEILEVKTAE